MPHSQFGRWIEDDEPEDNRLAKVQTILDHPTFTYIEKLRGIQEVVGMRPSRDRSRGK